MTLLQLFRVFSKIDITDTCWYWTASKCSDGYGTINFQGKTKAAHRLVWTLLRGEIPDGLELDHLCKNRACVNPDHLEPVTHRENVLRGDSLGARCVRRGTCDLGHPMVQKTAQRTCETCQRAARRQRYLEHREEKIAYARAHRAANKDRINARRRELDTMKKLEAVCATSETSR